MTKLSQQALKTRSWFLLLIVALFTGAFLFNQTNKLDKREKYEQFLAEKMSAIPQYTDEELSDIPKPTRPDMAAMQDYFATLDPETGAVHPERLFTAYDETKALQQKTGFKSTDEMEWEGTDAEMGGRTRALMWDPNDASGNKVWAGAVTGGLWYRDDITDNQSKWQPVDNFWSNINISSITYDPNDPMTFYVGTGEVQTAVIIYRESSGIGQGIWKTTDGGQTWDVLTSTMEFEYVTDVKVRNEDGESILYAGVASGIYHGAIHQSEPSDGLFRSEDGGETWEQVLPDIPGYGEPYCVADIEIGADNRLYVGSMQNVELEGGATILYSDEGGYGDWNVYDDYVAIIESHGTYNTPARVMLACAPSDENIIYAALVAGYDNGFKYFRGRYIIKSEDKGESWNIINKPDNDWATLGWHALIIRVHPEFPNTVYTGGLDLWKTSTSGSNWSHVSDWSLMYYGGGDEYLHADQHALEFKPGSSTEFICSNDGGVFYTSSATSTYPVFEEKNQGFNTLQLYSCDIHSQAGAPMYVGGLQDNGTLLYQNSPLGIDDMIDGGDGAFCFMDDDEPSIWITSVYYNRYTFWMNGQQVNYDDYDCGIFINPADYDSENNTLYANATSFFGSQSNTLLRIDGIPLDPDPDFVSLQTGTNVYFSHVKVSPHTPAGTATLYLGTQTGRVYKIENAHLNSPQTIEITDDAFPTAYVSCIAVGETEDKLMVTFSNYGVESVWQTLDGGESWDMIEGNLPDMPIRWAMYHPENDMQALLATEIGVWSTYGTEAEEMEWEPDVSGMANVRVDMLQFRESDNTVLAATHGRGFFEANYPVDPYVSVPENAQSELSFEVYPNPSSGIINLKLNNSTDDKAAIKIFDVSGRLVIEDKVSTGSQTLDLSALPKGNYVLKVQIGKTEQVEKIVLR